VLPEDALSFLSTADPKLGELISQVGDFKLEVHAGIEPYQMLMRSVTHQQLSGKAAKTIFDRFIALFPGAHFPAPSDILRKRPETLRGCGLSNSKVLSIRDIAERTAAGDVPSLAQTPAMSDEDIIEQLTKIRGVGVWTAQMYLMFGLGRLDVLPINDYGVQKGFQKTYRCRRLPTPDRIERHGKKWKPYRSVASWYLWRALEGVNKTG